MNAWQRIPIYYTSGKGKNKVISQCGFLGIKYHILIVQNKPETAVERVANRDLLH